MISKQAADKDSRFQGHVLHILLPQLPLLLGRYPCVEDVFYRGSVRTNRICHGLFLATWTESQVDLHVELAMDAVSSDIRTTKNLMFEALVSQGVVLTVREPSLQTFWDLVFSQLEKDNSRQLEQHVARRVSLTESDNCIHHERLEELMTWRSHPLLVVSSWTFVWLSCFHHEPAFAYVWQAQ